MSDKELAQVTFAMRIFDHDVDISYSTREPPISATTWLHWV